MAEVAAALWEVPAEAIAFAEGRVLVARGGDAAAGSSANGEAGASASSNKAS